MAVDEKELLKLYLQALLPDTEEHEAPPFEVPLSDADFFQPIAEGELQNYYSGMERNLILLQEKINQLKAQAAHADAEKNRLENECAALRWQLEYDRKLLHEIHSSKSWRIARLLHYFYGIVRCNRAIWDESRGSFDALLLRQCGSSSVIVRKNAQLLRRMLHGTATAVKRIAPTGAEGGSLPPEESQWKDFEKITYRSVYQDDESFRNPVPEVRAIAFYLPQFHTFPENDQWWGKGFTEWVNTRKAKPRFPGHYQPRTPHRDIGYYDLSRVETMKKQAELARAHGIEGFCLYYYWFDGKKLMERPLELLLAHPEIPLTFCLCWANENWTRTWDGQEKAVLIQQNYSDENDLRFIADLKKYLLDPRYLRVNGRPVVLVYHVKILPHPDKTFATWRQWCRENGVGEIQIWSCRTFIKNNEFRKPLEVDREVEFPPHMVAGLELMPPSRFRAYRDDGYYFNYNRIIDDVRTARTMADRAPYPVHRCAMLGWDNSCRRAEGYSIWQYFSLESYHFWMRRNIEYTRKHFHGDEQLIFINAWNEWAEGTYLEPDERYGYAAVNTTTRALCNLPALPEYQVLTPVPEDGGAAAAGIAPEESPGKILIHLHVFYVDLLEEFIAAFNRMPFAYDCVITTDTRKKAAEIKKLLHANPLSRCGKFHLQVTSNRGRDVAPFFTACAGKIEDYDFIGHFHTKKSLTVDWGEEWRRYLIEQLLGTTEGIRAIFRRFERDGSLGLYFPAPYPAMRDYMHWEKNLDRCRKLLKEMKLNVDLPEKPLFPVGQMFWARREAVAPLFAPGIIRESLFEPEEAQVSDTLAHAIERLWKYVAEGAKYTTLAGTLPPSLQLFPAPAAGKNSTRPAGQGKIRRLAIFVHYQKERKLSPEDLYLLGELRKSAEICLVSNSGLDAESRRVVSPLVRNILSRKNEGYDFGAWRDALNAIEDLNSFDELILLNNSVIGPFYPFETIFERMGGSEADFWGMTAFPETHNPLREEAKALPGGVIPHHIQSYFMVFKRKVFESECFRNFWRNVKNETSLPEVVAHYETQLSGLLEKAGFRSEVYLRTAARLQEIDKVTPEYNAVYCRPRDFLILGFPFLKKNICYYLPQEEINETLHLIAEISPYPIENVKITARTR